MKKIKKPEIEERIIDLKRQASAQSCPYYRELAKKLDNNAKTLANPHYVDDLQKRFIAHFSPLIKSDDIPVFFTINEYKNRKMITIPESKLMSYNPSSFLERVKNGFVVVYLRLLFTWYLKLNLIIDSVGYLIYMAWCWVLIKILFLHY